MPKAISMPKLAGTGGYDVEVVGESHYQRHLVRIAGRHTSDGRRVECPAVLFLEKNNSHDPNAICVEIGGKPVGYIPRYVAADLRNDLARIGILPGRRVAVDAVIVGGRTGEKYGVWLDIDMGDNERGAQELMVAIPAQAPDGVAVLVTALLVLVTMLAIGLMLAYALR